MSDRSKSNRNVTIRLRPASIDDLSLLIFWDKQSHVIAAAPNDEWDWESELRRDLEWRELLIAESGDRPIGFIQIIDPAREETHYWGDIGDGYRAIDIWIGEAENLGKGYGTEMMRLTLDRCFSDPKVTAVWVDPLEFNTQAHRFYERLGFKVMAERRFGEDDCLVYCLDCEDWELKNKSIK